MGKRADPDSVYSLNYSRCMLSALQNFRQNETMLDVTLFCNGRSLKAHKLVLASISQTFKQIFSEHPCNHPVLIIRECDFEDLKAIIDFIYKGHLSVPKERLMSTLKLAEEFNIRGLISNENSEKYKSLYGQICGKTSNRKKRKRHRHNSRDSEDSNYVKISESDDQNMESSVDNVDVFESRVMDVESVCAEESIVNEKEVRPLVLRVGDLSTSNEESIPKDEMDKGDSNVISLEEKNLSTDDALAKNSSIPKEDTEVETYEVPTESTELSSQFDAYTAYSENSNLESVPEDETNNSQGQSMEIASISEVLENQTVFTPLLSKPSDASQDDESRSPDEGKRFICSKCDSVFTSRISFMRHKTFGHNNEKNSHKCQFCVFTTEDMDILKHHLRTHNDTVPYKCSTCSKEFASEDVYQKHVSLHEVEEITLQGFSAAPEQDLLSLSNTTSTKNLEFRCSICFIKFSSKLRCQIHEKTCQGGS